jgi:anti-anti-sigma regulatory factor
MSYPTTTAPAESSATASSPSPAWLTAVLRPAGTLDGASAAAFGRLLDDLSATADMIVVDLDATRILDLAAFVGALWPAAARLAGPGKCLLLLNIPDALEHAVSVTGVPAATLAADAVPIPAHPHEGRPTF